MNDRDLTAYCGLYCGDCIRYRSRAPQLANELIKEFENTQFSEYAKVKRFQVPAFEHFDEMARLLSEVAHLKCEVPCRLGGDGCVGGCRVVACVKEKSFEGCWECSRYEDCEKLDFLKTIHGDAPRCDLGKIKKFGIDAWADHRSSFYTWKK